MTYGETIYHRRNYYIEQLFKDDGAWYLLVKNAPPRMERKAALRYYNQKLRRAWRQAG